MVRLISVHFDIGFEFSHRVEDRPLTFKVAVRMFALDRFWRVGGCSSGTMFWFGLLLVGESRSGVAVLLSVVWFVSADGGWLSLVLFWVCRELAGKPCVVDATPPTVAPWPSLGGSPVARWTTLLASGSLEP